MLISLSLVGHKVAIGPVISAKAVFKASVSTRLISQDEFSILLLAVDARNLTLHTYNEELAETIASKIKTYFDVMSFIINRID